MREEEEDARSDAGDIEEKSYMVSIWDSVGMERSGAILTQIVRKMDAIVLVFDITNKASFNSIRRWHDKLSQVARADLPFMVAYTRNDTPQSKHKVT